MYARTALPQEDGAGLYFLAAKAFDAKEFRIAVSTVLTASKSFFMCHWSSLYFLAACFGAFFSAFRVFSAFTAFTTFSAFGGLSFAFAAFFAGFFGFAFWPSTSRISISVKGCL
jgi:hypothetical protein